MTQYVVRKDRMSWHNCVLFIVQNEVISEILGDDSLAIINTICQCFCSFYIYTHIYKKQQCTVKKFDRQINRDDYLSSFFTIDLLSTHVKSCSVTWTVMIWRLFTVHYITFLKYMLPFSIFCFRLLYFHQISLYMYVCLW